MAGLVPAIHVFGHHVTQDVDARHVAGHDGVMREPRLRRMSRYGNEPRAFWRILPVERLLRLLP